MTVSSVVAEGNAVDTQTQCSSTQSKYRLCAEARARFRKFPKDYRSADVEKYFRGLSTPKDKLDFYFYMVVERKINPGDLESLTKAVGESHATLCRKRLAIRQGHSGK